MARRVAVIGAGVIGLAAAWALERRGFACLVFENGAPGGGQSAGESRIFRHAHADPRQFDLALEARRGWTEWEDEFDARLILPGGSMVIGEEAVATLKRYSDDPGISVRELGPDAVAEALPLMARFEGPAMIDDSAGAIRTRLVLANLIGAVGLNLVPEKVESVRSLPDGGVEVTSTLGPRIFDAAVIAAGTGTAELAAGDGVGIPINQRAHLRLTMPISSGRETESLACIQDSSGVFGEVSAYGSPVRGNREYAVGLAVTAGIAADPGNRSELDRIAHRTVDYVRGALPGLDVSAAEPIERWVTELPWATDGLAIWQKGDAYFIAGHNLFKLAPALGNALARAVVAGEVEPGLTPEARLGEPVMEHH
jgi:sarcosine oxidase